jgi:hypothetical protein
MSAKNTPAAASVGDWLEARGIHGEPARRGQIVEILGEPGHEHYKVHWDERHESIVYPADGVIISPGPGQRGRGAARRPRGE